MKFTAIFLTGAALAQHAIIFSEYSGPQPVNPTPGSCTPISDPITPHATTSSDIGLIFFSGHNCDGKQVATSIGEIFNPTGPFFRAKSVKTVSKEELANEEASYYIYWGRY
jgi:hypothetical protein